MSFHKAIESGKEHRVEYGTKGQMYAKAVDSHCRNHGECIWCKGNRLYKSNKQKQETKSKIMEAVKIHSDELTKQFNDLWEYGDR